MSKLKSAVKFNGRKNVKTTTIFQSIMLAITLIIPFIVNVIIGVDEFSTGYPEFALVIFLFVCGLMAFKEQFYYLSLYGLNKGSISTSILIDGLIFTGVNALITIVVSLVSHIVYENFMPNSPFDSMLDITSIQTFLVTSVLIFALSLFAYFFGVMLTTVNYRLNTLGKVIFWVLFGIVATYLLNMVTLKVEEPDVYEMISNFVTRIFDPLVNFILWTFAEAWRMIVVALGGAVVSYGVHRVLTVSKAEIKY